MTTEQRTERATLRRMMYEAKEKDDERRLLEAIHKLAAESKQFISLAQLCDELGWTDRSKTYSMLEALERQGKIAFAPGKRNFIGLHPWNLLEKPTMEEVAHA